MEDKLSIWSTIAQNMSYNFDLDSGKDNTINFSDFPIFDKLNPLFDIINNDEYISLDKDINKNEQEKLYIIEKKNTRLNPRFITIKDKLEKFKEIRDKNIITKKIGKRRMEKTNLSKRNRPDNILRKINVHFLSFIVTYLNDILRHLGYHQKFLNLDYSFKRKANKSTIEILKNKPIGLLISNSISIKYKNKNLSFNKILYEKIKNNEVIGQILSEKYLTLFKNIYYRNNKIINLKKYGLEEKVKLSNKVKTYEDLLLKGKKINKRDFTQCIKRNFIQESIFLIN